MGNSFEKVFIGNAGTAAGGGGLDIDDVFSTYLYTGNSGSQTITNGIDLTEGGLVWTKSRSNTYSHGLYDTERGATKEIKSDANTAESTDNGVTAFNANGYNVGNRFTTNTNAKTYVSWTWRKAPKFFDIVKYTGNGVNGRTISHNLGSVPGMILIKGLDTTFSWHVFHRSLPTETGDFPYTLSLDTTAAQAGSQTYYGSGITSTEFKINRYNAVNQANKEYVAYIFAHNDSDGEFGPDGDQDIIKCGSYTGNGSSQDINLGFEAQWVMFKPASVAGNWNIMDVMREMPTSGENAKRLRPNDSGAESGLNHLYGTRSLATGFTILGQTIADFNKDGENYIYMAIRRGPLAVPDDATKVFNTDVADSTGLAATFPIDMSIFGGRTGTDKFYAIDRVRGGNYSFTNTTAAELSNAAFNMFQNGSVYYAYRDALDTNYLGWLWRRAPGYFDVVAYSGTNSAKTVGHNLTVTPEMMWVKSRSNANRWTVFHKDMGPTKRAFLDLTQAFDTGSGIWNNTAPTSTVFTVGTDSNTNYNGHTFIAYLFATAPGVSKVGSASHSGTTNVDCGFTSGARFVMLKRTDAAGAWYVWDSVRGIIAGNDPYLLLNSTAAEVTNTDYIDPLNAGFTISDAFTDGNYIFYAIA